MLVVTYAQHLRVQWWEGGAELGVRCRAQHCKATITELELMELHSFQDGSKDADRRGFRTKGYCKLLFIAMIAHILHLTVCLSGGRPSALRYYTSIPSPCHIQASRARYRHTLDLRSPFLLV